MINEETIFDRQLRPIVEREIMNRPAEARHTQEPWNVADENCGGGYNIEVDGKRIAHTAEDRRHHDDAQKVIEATAKANARRIVACVNACAGIETERLTHGVVLENAQRVALERWDFKAQRDELLATLREVGISAREGVTKMTPELLSFIDAAIAKVKP